MRNMSSKTPVTGRVRSIKSKFESLNLEPLDITGQLPTKRTSYQFQRSATAFDLITSGSGNNLKPTNGCNESTVHKIAARAINTATQNKHNDIQRQSSDSFLLKSRASLNRKENKKPIIPLNGDDRDIVRLSRQTSDPIKRGSIKRSPAFRIGEKQNKLSPVQPIEFDEKFEELLKRCVTDTQKLQEAGMTDTIKAALKQPLPAGPPPKKPPRLFVDSPSNAEFDTINEFQKRLDEEECLLGDDAEKAIIIKTEVNGKSSSFPSKNILSCFNCTANSPIYDTLVTHPAEPTSTFFLDLKPNNGKEEHIYMEPFSHLNTLGKSMSATSQRSDSPQTSQHSSCECPEKHSELDDTHYLCTSICDSVRTLDDSNGNDSDQNLSSLGNTYDEINILVNAAFEDKVRDSGLYSMGNTPDKEIKNPFGSSQQRPSMKVSRSLTEKRKDYVRRVSANKSRPNNGYGTLQTHTVISPVNRSFDSETEDDESVSIETTSERINRYKQLVEATNANNVLLRSKKASIDDKQESHTDCDTIPQLIDNSLTLFKMCLLIGFNLSTNSAYIKSKFPSSENAPQNIEQLVFPSRSIIQQGKDNQNYSLILTDDNGNRLYGYCRRILPESSEICLPLAYCVLSTTKAPGFYFKVLKEIEMRHGQTDSQTNFLLKHLQCLPIPPAGKYLHMKMPVAQRPKSIFMSNHKISPKRLSLEANPKWLTEAAAQAAFSDCEPHDSKSKKTGLKSLVEEFEEKKQEKGPFDLSLINRSLVGNRDSKSDEILIRRPNDLRLESTELSDMFQGLGAELLINVFGTLLHERKVILYSKSISKLSSCVLGLQTILYPFQWQYTLVSILPQSLEEICQAPFPVLAGMLERIDFDIEDGIVVDLDAKKVVQKCGDENSILPNCLRESLLISLDMVDYIDQGRMLSSVLIAEAFLRFFVELFAGYKSKEFDKEAFIQSHSVQSVHLFLEWFAETAMFRHFVNTKYVDDATRLDPNFYALFDARLIEKSENKSKPNHNIEMIMRNCKIINRKAKTIKDRFKGFLSNN